MTQSEQSRASSTSSKLEFWMIILIPFASLVLAAWMYFGGSFLPEGRTHKGVLLDPPLKLEAFDSPLLVDTELEGQWGILVVTDYACEQECRERLHLTRQSYKALDRDTSRVKRYLVSAIPGDLMTDELGSYIKKEHPDLTVIPGSLPDHENNKDERVRVYLTDPLGNVMLWYGKEHDGAQMLKDLERLLKASRIG
ncbi:hypothetical protein [Parendozoicomonas haliclonae]|uniref:Cytochrome oxidase Cu insertion factor, SCO1/SenC/PrrC family n=1 Tax=Parendozoicomonas haliclonae TaxID=1960125 RepID=A0A1X7AJ74_9GAMM|nr:hypothetical protein [Parendozoicomonas haliclonae]SMA46274.1 hypothetical protein EHSB41UT_02119 [Parendozoicomonas haliclonae]